MLIVLEGLDGAGKSTQIKRISEYLASAGRQTEFLHFPRFDAPVYGDLIGGFLRGEFGDMDKVHPKLVALLFAEDRRDASSVISSWISEGKVVILDRYVYSNIAFQCAKLDDGKQSEDLERWILDTEYGAFGIPKPDLNLFLDVPESFVAGNLSSGRNGDGREYLKGRCDIHESDISFQMKVREVYLRQVDADPDFIRVDCSDGNGGMADADTVFSRIRNELDRMF